MEQQLKEMIEFKTYYINKQDSKNIKSFENKIIGSAIITLLLISLALKVLEDFWTDLFHLPFDIRILGICFLILMIPLALILKTKDKLKRENGSLAFQNNLMVINTSEIKSEVEYTDIDCVLLTALEVRKSWGAKFLATAYEVSINLKNTNQIKVIVDSKNMGKARFSNTIKSLSKKYNFKYKLS